jgi:hypothetical protein
VLVVHEVGNFSTEVLWRHCVIFICWGADHSRLDACAFSLLGIDEAVFWSRRDLSLSLSLCVSPAENISGLSSCWVSFCCYRNSRRAGLGMCSFFFEKWLSTRNRIIMIPFLSSNFTSSNPVLRKRGSGLILVLLSSIRLTYKWTKGGSSHSLTCSSVARNILT